MAAQTGQRVTYLYEVMDAAYDAQQIRGYSEWTGHVAIIDSNPRRDTALKEVLRRGERAESAVNYRETAVVRYGERTTIERVNARLKGDCGGSHVRVRGHAKVYSHLMFGILALTVEQLRRLMLWPSPVANQDQPTSSGSSGYV